MGTQSIRNMARRAFFKPCKGVSKKLHWTAYFHRENFSNAFTVPDAPTLTVLRRNTTQTSCSVAWMLPVDPKGILVYFRIQITFSHFLYNKSTLCNDSFRQQYEEIVEGGKSTNYTVKNMLNCASYQIRVQAANQHETGNFSDAKECVTLPGMTGMEHLNSSFMTCLTKFQVLQKKSKIYSFWERIRS